MILQCFIFCSMELLRFASFIIMHALLLFLKVQLFRILLRQFRIFFYRIIKSHFCLKSPEISNFILSILPSSVSHRKCVEVNEIFHLCVKINKQKFAFSNFSFLCTQITAGWQKCNYKKNRWQKVNQLKT